jgi:cytochrome P450
VSITLYRLSPFHPLAKYPGPVLARITRFWATRHAIGGSQNRVSHELFERYGDVVRTGPNHLIIRNASAIPVVLGAKNPWPKHTRKSWAPLCFRRGILMDGGIGYSVVQPFNSSGNLLNIISPAEHSKRRKVWDRAFTPAAIKSYEEPLQSRVAELLGEFGGRLGQPLDLAGWFGFFSLDFMGDFAYGRNGIFSSMAHGADHTGAHHGGVRLLSTVETVGTMPWLRPLLLPVFNLLPSNGFQVLARSAVATRMKKGSQFRDLFSHLVRHTHHSPVIRSHLAWQLNEDGEGGHPPLSIPTLGGEAGLAILAGSDTTGTALANAMYYLITHPESMVRLRAELDAAAGEGAAYDVDIDADKLAELKYLQAVISETLRLQPAIPNGVQRTPPSEGGDAIVAGQYATLL